MMRETLGTINKFIDQLLFKIYLIHVYLHLVCLQFLKSRGRAQLSQRPIQKYFDLDIINIALDTTTCLFYVHKCTSFVTLISQEILNIYAMLFVLVRFFPLENRFGLKYKQAAEGNTKQNSIKVSMYVHYIYLASHYLSIY